MRGIRFNENIQNYLLHISPNDYKYYSKLFNNGVQEFQGSDSFNIKKR